MYSLIGDWALPQPGFPIRTSPDQSLLTAPRGNFAVRRVLRQLLAPRHPPCALISLTTLQLFPLAEGHEGSCQPMLRMLAFSAVLASITSPLEAVANPDSKGLFTRPSSAFSQHIRRMMILTCAYRFVSSCQGARLKEQSTEVACILQN